MHTSDKFEIAWELCCLFEELSNLFFNLYHDRFIERYLQEQEAKYGGQKLQENE
jgi:hypothetical protein